MPATAAAACGSVRSGVSSRESRSPATTAARAAAGLRRWPSQAEGEAADALAEEQHRGEHGRSRAIASPCIHSMASDEDLRV